MTAEEFLNQFEYTERCTYGFIDRAGVAYLTDEGVQKYATEKVREVLQELRKKAVTIRKAPFGHTEVINAKYIDELLKQEK